MSTNLSDFGRSMPARCVAAMALVAVLLFAAAPRASADTVTVVSNGSVTFLDSGTSATDFAAPFTSGQFTAARTGTAAFVQSSTPFYLAAISGTSWIGTNSTAAVSVGDTALFAASFTLPSGVSSASLNLSFMVDNDLGGPNAGVYINGTALPGSTGIPCGSGVGCIGAFAGVNTFTDASIGSLLVSGTNFLYIDAVNLGGPGASDFSATITYTPVGTSATPEPSSLLMLGSGFVGLMGIARRRLRAS